jgi:hypothetical protein
MNKTARQVNKTKRQVRNRAARLDLYRYKTVWLDFYR